jgi:hypothetical protein
MIEEKVTALASSWRSLEVAGLGADRLEAAP